MGQDMRVIISAGGSGGHLLPAQQLAEKLLQKNIKLHFIAKGLTAAPSFQREKFSFSDIASGPLSGKKFFISVFSIMKGFFQGLRLLLSFNPQVVVGFGSYHSFPLLLAAKVLRKPIVLFAPDTTLGRVNRFFAKKAKAIAMQFPDKSYKNAVKVPLLPWKLLEKQGAAEARKELGLNPSFFTILVFGGSQGAKFINEVLLGVTTHLKKRGAHFQVIHLTGSDKMQDEMQYFYEANEIPAYVRKFAKNMPTLYSAADLAISRAGASTIAELITFELPSILIPFPFAMEEHQQKNAYFLAKEIGGAINLAEFHVDSELLSKIIMELLFDGGRLQQIKNNIRAFKEKEKFSCKFDLADLVLEVGKNGK
jgi:UDP-N-acetylglucosamine--N-acetylmuramyl-(pentapeptide) pyrophosphoryl-undecaprenol N-acetylglucosamine transferase